MLVGAPGVGKTSLVQRFVHSVFSETHKSTLGVKVDRKSVDVDGNEVSLLIWDMHGETDGLDVPPNYLSGAAAGIVVFDRTRLETVPVALGLGERLSQASPNANIVYVANKSDLDYDADGLKDAVGGKDMFDTSAKTGDGVEAMFFGIASSLG